MTFAMKVKNLRLGKGLSQQQLAQISGISKRTIIHYENGDTKPSKHEFYDALASALEVDCEYLYDDNEAFIKRAQRKYGTRGAAQAKQLLEDVSGLFAGGEMAEEDKDEMMRAIQDAYWISKEKNRKKYGKKSNDENSED